MEEQDSCTEEKCDQVDDVSEELFKWIKDYPGKSEIKDMGNGDIEVELINGIVLKWNEERKKTIMRKVPVNDKANKPELKKDSNQNTSSSDSIKNGNLAIKFSEDKYEQIKKFYGLGGVSNSNLEEKVDFSFVLPNGLKVTGYKTHKILFQGKDSELEEELKRWEDKADVKADKMIEGRLGILFRKILED